MLRKRFFFQPVVNFCQKICNMSSLKEKEAKKTTKPLISDGNMTKRSRKKLRRYKHQQKLEKKTVATEDSKQLPNYCEENYNETDYYHQNGLRKVYPYYYSFTTYAKGRWMGRTLLDVFTDEFHSYPPEYYKYNIEMGRVTVNKETVSPDFILGNNHLIEHTCHRHENPIKHTDLEILVDNDEVLVVNKPSSWPMHPCGRYRYNSLTTILCKQYGYENLRSLYRLDRLTSGVLMMAKTADFAAKVMKDIAERNVQKEYVARVVGFFPDGIIECKEPLSCVSHKMSIYRTDSRGKESSTTFERLSYNGKTSVVKCMPHTGRTHQIRVHLQYLGHPIINDNLYNSEAFGPTRGKGGLPEDIDTVQLEKEILKHHNVGMFFESYENPVFLRKQADAKERNIKTGKELQDKSKCSALENDSVDTSISADIDMPIEGNSVAVNDLTHEKMENTSMNSSENIEVVHSKLCDSSEKAGEPAHKRIKVDSAEVKDEKSSAVMHELDAQNLEIGKYSCVNDQESFLHTVESLDDRTSALNKDAAESYQTMHNVTDKTHDKSDIEANSGCTEKYIAQTNKPVGGIVGEYNEEKMYELTDLCCKDCKTVYIDPKEEDLVMYLHAYRYKGSDWEYGTPLPDWAHEDWQGLGSQR